MKIAQLKDKNALIMGLGNFGGGLDSALFASKYCKNVLVTDMLGRDKLEAGISSLEGRPNIQLRLGEHLESDFAVADVVILNPAVRPDNKYVQIAREGGAVISSQMEIFFANCPAPIVGITGANGKSTTTKLTWHLLDYGIKSGALKFRKAWLGGNIGNMPLLTELENITKDDIVVLEISSFQAELLGSSGAAPDISVLINITPNHLDRHGTFEAYCAAKENLFTNQKAGKLKAPISIFNAEDDITAGMYDRYSRDKNRKCIKFNADDVPVSVKANFPLPGRINQSNLAAAMAVAANFGLGEKDAAQAVKTFKGLPHRLELVAQGGGVRWYNDSKATTPPSTMVALQSFSEPIILIAGGYDKKLPFDEMGAVAAKKAKAAILIGVTAEKIAHAIEQGKGDCVIYMEKTFAGAVNRADAISKAGDVVVLSTACASFDMFVNYEQRGEIFGQLAREICSKKA